VFDPKFHPATAAVEKLKFSPERKVKRVRLLSERDEDFGYDDMDENDDCDIQCLKNPLWERRTERAFDMTSLSRISASISKEHGRPVGTDSKARRKEPRPQSSQHNIKKFFSIGNTARDRDAITKKQRRLVRCIAWDSRLAQLDSSPSVAVCTKRFYEMHSDFE